MICRMAGTKGEEDKGFDIRQIRYILRNEKECEEKRKMNKNGIIFSWFVDFMLKVVPYVNAVS